jgi:hypothetical protein
MKTTRKEYIEKKNNELLELLGCFFAFNTQQFEEGIEKAGGIEKRGKYTSIGHGLYCPTKDIKKLFNGLDKIKEQWAKDRKPEEKVKLKFMGIDNYNRPVWKDPKKRAYYGSVNRLFSYEAAEEEVLKEVDTFELCYFGNHFGCEPMGTELPNKYYI